MPYVTYTIGAYSFVNGLGEVPVWRQRVERLVYAGVDGARYRNLGAGSQPFQVETYLDVLNVAAARTLLGSYAALVGSGLQTFIWKSISYSPGGVVVLDVEPVQISSVLHVAGRRNSASNQAQLRARWTLELKQ